MLQGELAAGERSTVLSVSCRGNLAATRRFRHDVKRSQLLVPNDATLRESPGGPLSQPLSANQKLAVPAVCASPGLPLSGNGAAIRRYANAIVTQQPLADFLERRVELIGRHGIHNPDLVLPNK